MHITKNTTIGEILNTSEFDPYTPYLMYRNPHMEGVLLAKDDKMLTDLTLSEVGKLGWSPEGVEKGLIFLQEQMKEKRISLHRIYDESVCMEPQMKEVNLIRLQPKQLDPLKPTILLAAGGGYMSVCTLVESLPTGRHFVEAGYQVFLLTYHVYEESVTPKAVADMAAAISYLDKNRDAFAVDISNLVIGGYSAGANLISNWGVPSLGYQKYELPKPKALLPVYTYIDLKTEPAQGDNGGLLRFMFGENFEDYIEEWNIAQHIDAEYPPCYIVCGKDDATVPCENSERLKECLEAVGVPAVLDEGTHAQHGFGDGTGTDVEGWPERAMEFISGL